MDYFNISLHPKQAEVLNHPARFKVICAGRRWGKSYLSMFILITQASIGPKRKVWYVAPSYRMAKQIMWTELIESVPKQWVKRLHHTELSITLKNGSVIECKGADNPDSLRGVGLHYLVMDEFQDFKADTWEKVLRPTLAKDRSHAMIIGTPKGYANIYDLYKLGIEENFQWKSWQFPTITSPFIPELELEEAKRDMDPVSYRQEFLASFESISGRVYHQFDRKIHVNKYPFNPKLPIWVGQDFNIDPMSSAILQPQPNGEVWIVDEIHLPASNTQEVCEEIERRYWRYEKAITIYPDPAGNNRQHARGESDLDIFREKGFKRLKFRRKHPRVADRINSVNKLLMDAAGNVRLRVNSSCRNVINCFEQLLYKPGTRDVDKSTNIEHVGDALGYAIELEFPYKRIEVAGRNL